MGNRMTSSRDPRLRLKASRARFMCTQKLQATTPKDADQFFCEQILRQLHALVNIPIPTSRKVKKPKRVTWKEQLVSICPVPNCLDLSGKKCREYPMSKNQGSTEPETCSSRSQEALRKAISRANESFEMFKRRHRIVEEESGEEDPLSSSD